MIKCNCEKTREGSDIECPFDKSDLFGNNWNCGVINKIRDLCEMASNKVDDRLQYQYCSDDKYVTIKTDDIDSNADLGLCLWVSWYKNRGRTDAMWILNQDSPPRVPTIKDLNAILDYYSDLLKPKKLKKFKIQYNDNLPQSSLIGIPFEIEAESVVTHERHIDFIIKGEAVFSVAKNIVDIITTL